MLFLSCFEILPDEILLHVCQYLRGADVFYSLYNLNARLNITIAGYCRYINLMAVSYEKFEYSVSHVLPEIGSSVRSFVLNGNWETIINEKLSSSLFSWNLPFIFPQLRKLTIKWFTSEKFLSFVDVLKDFSQLLELDIQFLKGRTIDLVQSKVLCVNNNQLEIVSFDQDSIGIDLAENDTTISYPNIRQLTINLTSSKLMSRLFLLIPNVRCLHVNTDELSDNPILKSTIINLPSLVHLVAFKLHSINLFWTFDELTHVFKAMPSLQRLAVDLCTEDKRVVTEEDVNMILPSSVVKVDFFIRYYYPKSEDEPSISFSSTRFPIACLLDKPRRRFLIHTIPWNLRSAILPVTISEQMLPGWNYTQYIKDLYIYDITSLTDILLILQHFRRLRTLSIDMKDKSQILTLSKQSTSIHLNLPYLKQVEISGICQLHPVLDAAPNIDYMIISFDCLQTLLADQSTCQLWPARIIRLNIIDWVDVKSDLLQCISQIFRSLCHIVITMKDSTLLIDDFVLTILSLWKGKSRISIDVKGSLAEDKKKNLRGWITTHSHIRPDDVFAIEYNDNWFDLWY